MKKIHGMRNDTTYLTTRGTTGDADGITIVDDDIMEIFEDAEEYPLIDLKDVEIRAYEDMEDWISHNAPNTSIDDYFYSVVGCQYILLWG